VNPRLIYCSLTGYGQTGPYKHRAGHDINYLSIAGISSFTGREDSGPLPLGIQVADVCGGSLHSIIGILAAIIQRQATGLGQAIDISMTDTSFSFNAMFGANYLAGGNEPGYEQVWLNGGSFYDYYKTKEGGYMSVGSLEPKFAEQFFQAIARPDLFPVAYTSDPQENKQLKQEIQSVFLTKTLKQWQQIFSENDACVEPVLSLSEACDHPQIKARNMIVDVPTKSGDPLKQIGLPIKFSEYNPVYTHAGASLGEHTIEILKESGYSDEDIKILEKNKVFG